MLNLGAGPKFIPGTIPLDADRGWWASDGLPFADEEVAGAYAFHFLKFPFRRTLLIIIINAFVLPQQVVVIPLFTLWRQMGLIDNIASVLIPYVGLSFAWSILN